MGLLLWLGFALVAGAFVLIEILNVSLGVGANRISDRLERKRKKTPEPRFPGTTGQ